MNGKLLMTAFCLSCLLGFYVMGMAIERESPLMIVVGALLPFQTLTALSIIK